MLEHIATKPISKKNVMIWRTTILKILSNTAKSMYLNPSHSTLIQKGSLRLRNSYINNGKRKTQKELL